jgi:hypothetical protein
LQQQIAVKEYRDTCHNSTIQRATTEINKNNAANATSVKTAAIKTTKV